MGRGRFRALRFRSVKVCVETGQLNSCVTPVGRVLRRSGIDELPQLLNVLRGEMSIVGPRLYSCHQDLFENRVIPLLDVKPGMIGSSQITEFRERLGTTDERINNDLHYVENRSLFLDIKILLMSAFS